jgi:hypothetical protein
MSWYEGAGDRVGLPINSPGNVEYVRGWISVLKEPPPTDGTMFAVWDELYGFVPFVYADEDQDTISETFQWSGSFSYWMPQPGPPQRSTE